MAVEPLDQVVWGGATVTFDAVVLGAAPFAYQWLFNETVPIPGATNSSLTVSNAMPENVGAYTLVVSNDWGVVESQEASLRVSTNGPLKRILLFTDPAGSSGFPQALATFLPGREV